ncbi:MAG: hypothetical protein ACU0CA_15270 [Paracoccaceae bacterium]
MKTNQLTRRAALGAIAVTPLATLPIAAKPHDPIPEGFAEWKPLFNALNEPGLEDDTPEEKAAHAALNKLAIQISTTQATTAEGIAAQIQWFEEDIGYYVLENVDDSRGRIFGALLAGVRGLV